MERNGLKLKTTEDTRKSNTIIETAVTNNNKDHYAKWNYFAIPGFVYCLFVFKNI